MFVNERASQIIEYLKVHKKATIGELAKALFASESTVRRDLTEMQEAGLVARYHGGAILLEGVGEVSIFARAEKDAESKNRCADIAIKHFSPSTYNTIFIDNSSTCLALAKKLDFANKTVITNGLQVALALSQKPDIQLIIPGGTVNSSTSAIMGSLTLRTLDLFNVDLMLSSCAGIDGVCTNELSLETAQLKQVALSKSKYKMLVATENKFSTDASYRVQPLDEYDCVITDASDEIIEPFKNKNINICNS
ncbi:MAG: DeoR/GlpR transcriptional regulator [Clostridiales bacterium]|nr:DeoR/GlpR transcriptional regulator [Clostridiales bacterium]